jgi:hypothetical protein
MRCVCSAHHEVLLAPLPAASRKKVFPYLHRPPALLHTYQDDRTTHQPSNEEQEKTQQQPLLNAGPRQSSDNYQKRVEEYKEREEENYYAIDWRGYNTHPEGRK